MSALRRLSLGAVAAATALSIVTPLAGAAPAAMAPASPAAAATPGQPAAAGPQTAANLRCPGTQPTIKGTSGDDRLVGTPGPDVIDGGLGNDVIDGLGGNDVVIGGAGDDVLIGGAGDDVLCGGTGKDTLLGGAGRDTILGDEGNDVVSASYGEDTVAGGVGDDVLAAGPGDDTVAGGTGDDGAGGGSGDDRVSGDAGNDTLSGDDGADNAAGGLGRDRCSAESASDCEAPVPASTRSVTMATPVPSPESAGYRIDWSAAAGAGLRLIEIYAGDEIVGYATVAGTQRSGSTTVALSRLLPSTTTTFYAVATDALGEQAVSEGAQVTVPGSPAGVPPVTVFELDRPTSMASVVEKLAAAGLVPVEYRAERVPGPVPAVDPEVAAEVTATGETPYVLPDLNAVYKPHDAALSTQADDLAAYYAEHGFTGTPMISSVLVRGTVTTAGAGPLGTIGHASGSTPGGTARPGEPTPDLGAAPAAASRSAGPQTLGAAAPQPKTGRTAADGAATSRVTTLAAPAGPQVAFWPEFGQMNVATFERQEWELQFRCAFVLFGPACGLVPARVTRKKAELQHQIVWTRPALQVFADRQAAYEHNVKVTSPGRVGQKRPACNLFSEDNFYVRAEKISFSYSNVPSAAGYYDDDVIVEDPCSSNEVSFGIVYPEKLLDDVGPGRLPVVVVRQESDRNDAANRDFGLYAQALSRTNYQCGAVPMVLKKYCIGVDTSQNLDATEARTTTDPDHPSQIGDVGLPTCVVYSGHTFTPVPSARLSRVCGQDRDHDGYDDQIDCGPDDPGINPGAVDIPNDGIDQNCDGSDLVVGQGEIQVTLLWDNDDDEDLHVVEPGGQEIWYSSRGPTATGGRLDRDDNVSSCGSDPVPGGVENVFWPSGTSPARGTYRVDVVQYHSCGTAAHWTAEVRVGGQLRTRQTGLGNGSFTFSY